MEEAGWMCLCTIMYARYSVKVHYNLHLQFTMMTGLITERNSSLFTIQNPVVMDAQLRKSYPVKRNKEKKKAFNFDLQNKFWSRTQTIISMKMKIEC